MDEFTLSIPRERSFGTVAELVLGGIAARHDVTLDVVDDVQLALDALLDHGVADESNVSIQLRVEDGSIDIELGPLPAETAADLEQETDAGIGLKRLLGTVVDSVEVSERDGGSWVELRKAFAPAVAGS